MKPDVRRHGPRDRRLTDDGRARSGRPARRACAGGRLVADRGRNSLPAGTRYVAQAAGGVREAPATGIPLADGRDEQALGAPRGAAPPGAVRRRRARSGTTLLWLMLDAHPSLTIPPETHFIPS